MYPPGEQPHSGPQYPPGYPYYPQYQQPQGHPAYPPPWQAGPPPNPPAPPNHLGVGLAFGIGILTMAFVMGYMLLAVSKGGDYFTSGARVHPSPDESILFIRESDLGGRLPSTAHCTATTDSGESVALAPLAEPRTVSVGKYRKKTYVSVAQLPTDKGPLTVNCTGVKFADLLLMTPGSGPPAWLFFVGYGTLLGIMIVAVILTNRRYYRRNPHLDPRQ